MGDASTSKLNIRNHGDKRLKLKQLITNLENFDDITMPFQNKSGADEGSADIARQVSKKRRSLFFDSRKKKPSSSGVDKVKGLSSVLFSKTGNRSNKNRRTLNSELNASTTKSSRKIQPKVRSNENSTNSDDSNTGLFDGINWEENLEDAGSLIDEFAPRPPVESSPSPEAEEPLPIETIKIKEEPNEEIPDTKPVIIPTQEDKSSYEFSIGSEIHVKSFNSVEWFAACVMEVDWEEEEVLVHYKDNVKSDEWVAMSSQRLSQNKPTYSIPTIITQNIVKEEPKSSSDEGKKEGYEEKKVIDAQKSDGSKVVRKSTRTLQKKTRRKMRETSTSMNKIHSPKGYRDRFEAGEKVLAKWSDHRMQKFPAVIKRVLGNGRYDVLFYDGFEKTLTRDSLYKTTEEEVAKYQQSNPSEADSFVDIDIGSKEERRQRKRKTYDDFLFLKDFDRPKKKSQGSNYDMEKSTSSKAVKNFSTAVAGKGFTSLAQAVEEKLGNKLQSSSAGDRKVRRRKRQYLDTYSREAFSKEVLSDEVSSEAMPENLSIFDDSKTFEKLNDSSIIEYSSEHTLSAETSISTEDGEPKKVPVSQLQTDGERWIGDIPPEVHPMIVTGIDGIPRKSVIIPDKKLPFGWCKQAVKRQAGGNWEVFLVSPEGYRFHSAQQLKEYFRTLHQSDIPENVDFKVCLSAIPELVLKQKDYIASGNFRTWEKKRGRRRKSHFQETPSKIPQVPQQVGRVKTLLPKNRMPMTPQVQSPAPTATITTPSADSEVWRCPKQGCDKKFRKENLLQMHINHYHVEFKDLVGTAPKVVDLACARSESANSDWRVEQNKPPVHEKTIKRLFPKGNIQSSFAEKPFERVENDPVISPQIPTPPTPTQTQSSSVIRSEISSLQDDPLIKRQIIIPGEEKKTTIKTMLPLRQAQETLIKSIFDSDDGCSEDDVDGHISTGKMLKMNKNKKLRMEPKFSAVGPSLEEGVKEPGFGTYQSRLIKKKQIPAIDKLQIATDSNDSYTEEEKASPNTEVLDEISNLERLRSEELINCTCGFKEEDGLMIQCDICLCWQHGMCNGIEKETEVPDTYVCCICQNPYRVRSSKKFSYAQLYLTQAKLPTLSFRTSKEGELKQRENMLKRCYDISTSLHQIQNVERSLRAKINIAEQSDHPKLYLWAKNWDENSNLKYGESVSVKVKELEDDEQSDSKSEIEIKTRAPEPEAQIDLEECRLKLLEHVEQYQQHVESRLTTLEAQIAALESQDPDLASVETSESYPQTKRTVHMLLQDLETVKKLSVIS